MRETEVQVENSRLIMVIDTRLRQQLKTTFGDVLVSLACIVFTIAFDFVAIFTTEPRTRAEWIANHSTMLRLFERPLDLWLLGVTLLVGALLRSGDHQVAESEERKHAEHAWTVTPKKANVGLKEVLMPLLTLLAILALTFASAIFDNNWVRIYTPDLIGVGFVGFTVIKVSKI